MSATYMPFNIYFTTSATFDIELGFSKKLIVSMGILQPFQPGSQHLIIRVHIEMSNPHNHTNLDNGSRNQTFRLGHCVEEKRGSRVNAKSNTFYLPNFTEPIAQDLDTYSMRFDFPDQ